MGTKLLELPLQESASPYGTPALPLTFLHFAWSDFHVENENGSMSVCCTLMLDTRSTSRLTFVPRAMDVII